VDGHARVVRACTTAQPADSHFCLILMLDASVYVSISLLSLCYSSSTLVSLASCLTAVMKKKKKTDSERVG
jgi:hypothetical protein